VAYQHVREKPVFPSARNPEVPGVVDSIAMKALAEDPRDRYQSAGTMRQGIEDALAGQRLAPTLVSSPLRATPHLALSLTPDQVRDVAFKKPPIGKRGYDEEEVEAFLDIVETVLRNE
jgi:DivIVA domain-containing protein